MGVLSFSPKFFFDPGYSLEVAVAHAVTHKITHSLLTVCYGCFCAKAERDDFDFDKRAASDYDNLNVDLLHSSQLLYPVLMETFFRAAFSFLTCLVESASSPYLV